MKLHDRIMALPLVEPYAGRDYEAVELRNHASEIAKEADELIGSLVAALHECKDQLDIHGWSDESEYAQVVLDEYRRWKECTQ